MTKFKFIITIFMTAWLVACTTPTGNTDSLTGLKDLTGSKPKAPKKDELSTMRIQALQDIALSTGAQSGLAARSKEINAVLDSNANSLSRIFNFHALMLPHNVLPPVLSEGRSELNLADCSTIRLADRVYKIIKQACFVTAPPNWREYLYMNYAKPERPSNSLLPQNERESCIWDEAVTRGWNNGVKQANSIFRENLARLKRDYNGMLLYRQLLAENLVSPPYVAKTSLGITGTGSEMHINDQVLRITALPELQKTPKRWLPAVSPSYERACDITE